MAVIAAGVGAAASVFGAISSSNSSKAASAAQVEAVRLQTLVARELHEHWKSNYAACDAAAIADVCATPPFVAQYPLWQGRARLEILRSFARARDTMRKAQDIYNVGRAAQQCNYLAGIEAVALMDSVGFGRRWEDAQQLTLDQLRLTNAYSWLGLGRNLISQSTDAAALAAGAGQRLGAAAGAQQNGWLQAAGWLQGESGKRLIGQVSAGIRKNNETVAGSTPEERRISDQRMADDIANGNPSETSNAGAVDLPSAAGAGFIDPAHARAAAGLPPEDAADELPGVVMY